MSNTNRLSEYRILIQSFVACKISATEFQRQYLGMFKADNSQFAQDEFEELNFLFTSCDRFCENRDLFEVGNISASQLTRDAEKTLAKLWGE